jgi:hypothetical protein
MLLSGIGLFPPVYACVYCNGCGDGDDVCAERERLAEIRPSTLQLTQLRAPLTVLNVQTSWRWYHRQGGGWWVVRDVLRMLHSAPTRVCVCVCVCVCVFVCLRHHYRYFATTSQLLSNTISVRNTHTHTHTHTKRSCTGLGAGSETKEIACSQIMRFRGPKAACSLVFKALG